MNQQILDGFKNRFKQLGGLAAVPTEHGGVPLSSREREATILAMVVEHVHPQRFMAWFRNATEAQTDLWLRNILAKMGGNQQEQKEMMEAIMGKTKIKDEQPNTDGPEDGRRTREVVVLRDGRGKDIRLPKGMTTNEAMLLLKQEQQKENQGESTISIVEAFDCFVYDGAYALNSVAVREYGWMGGQEVEDPLSGEMIPPASLQIPTSIDTTVSVPWGKFMLPGIDGILETEVKHKEGMVQFRLRATVKQKHEDEIKRLAELVREEIRKDSIYRGKPLRVKFRDDNGDLLNMPEIAFIDLRKVDENKLVFNAPLQQQIATSLFAPVLHREACSAAGVPFKRGVLLAGPYGTGKTLAALVTAKHAANNGITYVYVESTDEFHEGMRFADYYQPAVLFCEDVDRVTSGDRDISMDEILNTIDGPDRKNSEVMVVLTSNAVEAIHPAMLRPGRLDSIIVFTAADRDTAMRLIVNYSAGQVEEGEIDEEVLRAVTGMIPAAIREVVERAKLYAINRNKGMAGWKVNRSDLLGAAAGIQAHVKLMADYKPDPRTDMEKFGAALGQALLYGSHWTKKNGSLDSLSRQVVSETFGR